MRTRQRWGTLGSVVGVGIAVMAFAACGGDDGGGSSGGGGDGSTMASATNEVTVAEFSFEPQDIEIEAGADVTWTNEDDFDHQITVRDGAFESDPFGGGETVSTSFADPGTYDYFCGIHNSMTGTITVT